MEGSYQHEDVKIKSIANINIGLLEKSHNKGQKTKCSTHCVYSKSYSMLFPMKVDLSGAASSLIQFFGKVPVSAATRFSHSNLEE